MAFPDIFDNTVLTELIRRDYEEIAANAGGGEDRISQPGRGILPLKSVNSRKVKVRIQDIVPVGMAQMKAPGSTPPLWTHAPNLREEVIELQDIDEMHRIDPEELLALSSQDPRILEEAHFSLLEWGVMLQKRNDLRTEWMRWSALRGSIQLEYKDSPGPLVAYGIPAGHFPDVGVPWATIATADPVEDLYAASAVGISDAGVYLPKAHMNSANWRYLRRNARVKEDLSTYGRSVMRPDHSDFSQLLRGEQEITLIDSGYMTENQSDKTLTKWIDDDEVFLTTADYTYAGHPIGDVADGWVLVSLPNQELPEARQGIQSEILGEKMGKETYLRQASARIPRLYAPEAIAWLTTS